MSKYKESLSQEYKDLISCYEKKGDSKAIERIQNSSLASIKSIIEVIDAQFFGNFIQQRRDIVVAAGTNNTTTSTALDEHNFKSRP